MPVPQTFETFLEVPSTTAALRMCRMVADDALPAGVFLLDGPTGTGKSHLLHAVANAARRRCAGRLVETRAVDLVADHVALSQETVSLIAERCGGDIGHAHGLVAQFGAAVRYSTRGAAAAALARVSTRPDR